MNKFLASLTLVIATASCSNTSDMETGEIRTLKIIKQAFDKQKQTKGFIEAKNLLSREQIDAAKTPVLFVVLESGQNGTLTPYPGKGFGQTWLGADGATITLQEGVLKASRGMGDDLMQSSSSMPHWSKIEHDPKSYTREFRHINGDNKTSNKIFECGIRKNKTNEVIEIWNVEFRVTKFQENCIHQDLNIKNVYYIDHKKVVRKSKQYHGNTLGYILTERLDR